MDWLIRLTFWEKPNRSGDIPGGVTEELSATYRFTTPGETDTDRFDRPLTRLTRDEVLVNASARITRRFGAVRVRKCEVIEVEAGAEYSFDGKAEE